MSRTIITSIFRFIILVFVQVFLLKNIGFYNLSSVFVYILFILLLPFNTPNIILFGLSFLLGFSVDLFYDTMGVHAAACVVMAFVRIIFISLTVQRDVQESEPIPNMSNKGFGWFFLYALFLTFFHHFTLYFMEAFRFSDAQYTLLRVALSSAFTVFLIILVEFLFYRKKER